MYENVFADVDILSYKNNITIETRVNVIKTKLEVIGRRKLGRRLFVNLKTLIDEKVEGGCSKVTVFLPHIEDNLKEQECILINLINNSKRDFTKLVIITETLETEYCHYPLIKKEIDSLNKLNTIVIFSFTKFNEYLFGILSFLELGKFNFEEVEKHVNETECLDEKFFYCGNSHRAQQNELKTAIIENGAAIIIGKDGIGKKTLIANCNKTFSNMYKYIFLVNCETVETILRSFRREMQQMLNFNFNEKFGELKFFKLVSSFLTSNKNYLIIFEELKNFDVFQGKLNLFPLIRGDIIILTTNQSIKPDNLKPLFEKNIENCTFMEQINAETVQQFFSKGSTRLKSLLDDSAMELHSLESIKFDGVALTLSLSLNFMEKLNLNFTELLKLQTENLASKHKAVVGSTNSILGLILAEIKKNDKLGNATVSLLCAITFIDIRFITKGVIKSIASVQKKRILREITKENILKEMELEKTLENKNKRMEKIFYQKKDDPKVDQKDIKTVDQTSEFCFNKIFDQILYFNLLELKIKTKNLITSEKGTDLCQDTFEMSKVCQQYFKNVNLEKRFVILEEVILAMVQNFPEMKDDYTDEDLKYGASKITHINSVATSFFDMYKISKNNMDTSYILEIFNRVTYFSRYFKLEFTLKNVLQQQLILQKLIQGDDKETLEIIYVLSELGKVCYGLTEFENSLNYYEDALKFTKNLIGTREHESVSDLLDNLAEIYSCIGNNQSAIDYYQESLDIKLKVYSENEEKVCVAYKNLAEAYFRAGENEKCTGLYKKSLEIQIKIHGGQENTAVATELETIASSYEAQKDFEMAKKYLKKSVEIKLAVLGTRIHPSVAKSLNSLGMIANSQQRYKKALWYCEEALNIYLGTNEDRQTSNVARVLNNLGIILHATGEYDMAIENFEESIEIKEKIYGTRVHPDISNTLHNFGDSCRQLGDYTKAAICYQEALETLVKINGGWETNEIAILLNNLGLVAKLEGNLSKAEDLYEESMQIKLRVFKTRENLSIATSLNNLAELAKSRSDFKLADKYYSQSLEIKEKIFFDDKDNNPEICTNLIKIGGVKENLKQFKEALDFYKKAYDINLTVPGAKKSMQMRNLLMKMGRVTNALKSYSSSLEYYQQAHTISVSLSDQGDQDYEIAEILKCMGSNSALLNDLKNSKAFYTQALEKMNILFGGEKKNMPTLEVMVILGNICQQDKDYIAAREFYKTSLDIATILYESNTHERLISLLKDLSNTEKLVGSEECYLKHMEQLLEAQVNKYNTREEVEVMETLLNLGCIYFKQEKFIDAINCHLEVFDFYKSNLKNQKIKEIFEAAIEILKKEVEVTESFTIKKLELDSVENIHLEINDKFWRGKSLMELVLKVKEKLYETRTHQEIGLTLINLGRIASNEGQTDLSFSYFEEAIKILEQTMRTRRHPAISSALLCLGELYFTIKDFEKSSLHLGESYDIAVFVLGETDPLTKQIAKLLLKVAEVYEKLGVTAVEHKNYSEAENFLENCIKIYKKVLKSLEFENGGILLIKMAEVSKCCKDYKKAILNYLEGLRILKLLKKDVEDEFNAKTLFDLADCFKSILDNFSAIKYFEEAWDLRKKINTSPNNVDMLNLIKKIDEIARDFESQGDKEFSSNDYITAIKFYQDSLAAFKKIDSKRDIAVLQTDLGKVFLGQHEYELAAACLKEAIDIYTKINGGRKNFEVAKVLVYYGKSVDNKCEVEETILLFEEAMDIFIQLDPSRSNEEVEVVSKNLIKAVSQLSKRGEALEANGNFDESHQVYKRCLNLLLKASGNKETKEYVDALKKISIFLFNQNNFELSLQKFEELLEIQIKLESLKKVSVADIEEIRSYIARCKKELSNLNSLFSCCLAKKKPSKIYPE
ncbi:hypothetical protein HDU92_002109 [Lobulomyces angularis]|nr:hypothetical protein HDU92_002109 [Lobulomyces angularis]